MGDKEQIEKVIEEVSDALAPPKIPKESALGKDVEKLKKAAKKE